MRVVLVRHGQAAGEPRPGELQAPLTPLGVRQAARVARRLADEKFDHIYFSDLSRAYHTAQAIRRYHRRTPYTVSRDIREVAGHHNHRGPTPRRKGVQERLRRDRKAVGRFARRLLRRHRPGERVLVVAHGNLIRFLISTLAEVNPKRSIFVETSNTSVTVLHLREGRLRSVELANCVKHLLPRQVT